MSYCAIGIKDTKIGAITNENGYYKITIPDEFQNKSIVFKAEGYLEKNLNLIELKSNANVYLEYKTSNIQEVILKAKKLKEKNARREIPPFFNFFKNVRQKCSNDWTRKYFWYL